MLARPDPERAVPGGRLGETRAGSTRKRPVETWGGASGRLGGTRSGLSECDATRAGLSERHDLTGKDQVCRIEQNRQGMRWLGGGRLVVVE